MDSDPLMLLAALTAPDLQGHDFALPASSEEELWSNLTALALAQGMGPLFCQRLTQLPAAALPPAMREAALQLLEKQQADVHASVSQLIGILSALERAGIPAIPFKGPTLAIRAYGSATLRSWRDLDLLIPEPLINDTLTALGRLGWHPPHRLNDAQRAIFNRYAGEEILFGAGLPIEPHWHIAPATLSIRLDYPALWQRAAQHDYGDFEALALAPEDELLVIALHGGKECWGKLKWVADLAWFAHRHPGLDWRALGQRGREQGVLRILTIGLQLADHFFSTRLTTQLPEAARRDPAARKLAGELAVSFAMPDRAGSVYTLNRFRFAMRERWSDRLGYVIRTLCQPRVQHLLSLSLPPRLSFLYYPYKMLHDYIALPLWRLLKPDP